jgi:hypothetical protein
MPLIRYEVTLPRDALRHVTAFAPVPASTTAVWSKNLAQGQTVTMQPGTQRIPAPRPGFGQVHAGPGSPLPGGAGGAGAAGSAYMPPCWFPSLYWARQQLWGAIGGVRAGWLVNARQGPAGRPMHALTARYGAFNAVPQTQQPGMRPHRARFLGQRQVAAGPVAPRWPRWGRKKHA